MTRVAIAVVTAFLCPGALHSEAGTRAESLLLRGYFFVQGIRPTLTDVLILGVDNRTKRYLGIRDNESIPRATLADTLLKLAPYQPKAIIFDATFQDPGIDPDADRRLADALGATPSVIGRRSIIRVERSAQSGKVFTTREVSNPLPMFAHAAKFVFPIHLALTANVVQQVAITGNPSVEKIPLLQPLRAFVDPTIPEPGDYDLINYYGPPSTIPSVPLLRLFSPENPLPPEVLRGKVILIGWTDSTVNSLGSPGMDTLLTPTSSLPMYGVEIHATIAANLLDRTWIHRLDPLSETILFFLITLLLAIFALSVAWKRAAAYTVGFALLWVGASLFAFLRFHFFIPAATLVAVLAVFVVVAGFVNPKARSGK